MSSWNKLEIDGEKKDQKGKMILPRRRHGLKSTRAINTSSYADGGGITQKQDRQKKTHQKPPNKQNQTQNI